MVISNRGLAGQPVLSYVDYRAYQGTDVFLDLTFLDHTGTAVTPSTANYQVDDITNAINMIPKTTFTPGSNPYTLQIPGSLMVMTHNWQGSQLCQFSLNATITDSVTSTSAQINQVIIIELIAIQTPTTQ